MNKVIWGFQILMAIAFMGAGGLKVVTPVESLRANPQMGWATRAPSAVRRDASPHRVGELRMPTVVG